jgi:cytochrome P450
VSAERAREHGSLLHPWDEAFRADPYPYYKRLYGRPPHLMNMFFQMALVAGYDDAVTILHDHERFTSSQKLNPNFDQQERTLFAGAETVLFSDPPNHTRLRRLVSRAFTPKRIRDLGPRIRELTQTLLDRAARKGELEVMSDLATPLPVMVIAEMLGVAPAQYEQFKHWSDRIVESDNTPPGMPLPDATKQAAEELRSFFANEIERRRSDPGEDLVSALVAAHDETEALSADELRAFVILLLLAGNETTTNLIGNGMLALGRNPDQIALLRGDPSLMPRAVEEMLRYDGPVQSTVRHNHEPVEVGGALIAPETMVFVILAAANRDPAHFSDPDAFDITREPSAHLAFGDGIHYCLGAALARLEGAIAFSSMLERFPRLRLTEAEAPPKYKGSYFLRGLSSLKMALD